MLTIEKTVIRSSGLPSYADCPRRAATKFLWDELIKAGYELRETPQGIGAALGSSTHASAAYSLNSKIYDGNLGSEDSALDLAFETFNEISRTEGIVYDGTTPTYDRAELQLKTLVRSYRVQVAPVIEPVEVEIRLEADIGGGFILSGQFDVREAITIRDLKTGAASRANISQYGAYALLCSVHQRTVDRIIEDYLPRKREPEVEFFEYDVGAATKAARAILKRIKDDTAAFRASGEPTSFIANPQSMLCSDRYCPAWGTAFCREHKVKGE
ncbi:MAG: PD-(D/E)XK nuclease family protein [Rickettsiales bacterium]|jgi:hypothetical protein|nr:PD-(D/E)XK nuclease family protein [Rickettsiales bacterium]